MKKIKLSILATCSVALLMMASCRKDNAPKPNDLKSAAKNMNAAVSAASFKVIGYLPSYAGSVSNVQFSKLTHCIYAFLIPTSTGGYDAIDNASKLTSMVTAAHAAGTKAMISVGGADGGGAYASIVASATNRTNFVNNMISFASQYNLDGIDIDWEYPSEGTQASNFLTLMQALSTALHNQGKVLSIAVIGEGYDNSILSGIFDAVDFVNVMAYDDNNFQHSTYELGTLCLNYWLGRGVPVAKAILGVPFYGHDSSKDPDADDDQVNYNTILSDGANANLDVYNTFGYNGLITMRSKTSYALSNGGGIVIWDLSGDTNDTNSLLSAIHSVIAANGTVSTGAPVGTVISLKGFNGKYVSGEDGTTSMTCTRATASDWEHFTVLDAGHGKIELRSEAQYTSSEDGTKAINCNRTTPGTWEMFDWIPNTDGSVTIRSTNGLFISSEDGTKAMTCNRSVASGWESFGVNQ